MLKQRNEWKRADRAQGLFDAFAEMLALAEISISEGTRIGQASTEFLQTLSRSREVGYDPADLRGLRSITRRYWRFEASKVGGAPWANQDDKGRISRVGARQNKPTIAFRKNVRR